MGLTGIGASQTTVAIAAPGIIGVGTSSTGVLPSYRSGEILAPAGRPASMTIPATASRMSLGNVPSAPGMLVASPRGKSLQRGLQQRQRVQCLQQGDSLRYP